MRYFFGGKMEIINKSQKLIIEDRKKLVIDGIINVDSFNENFMELSSNLGRIEIEGNNLKIEELRQDDGKIYICGQIDGIFYRENKPLKGFWSRFFK